MRVRLLSLTAACFGMLAACSNYWDDYTGPPRPSYLSASEYSDPALRCAGARMYRDARNGGTILRFVNGFAAPMPDKMVEEIYQYLNATIEYMDIDCSSTFAASPQQFANYIDRNTQYFVPPMYPTAQNPVKVRLRAGDPVPTNAYLSAGSTTPTNGSANALREAEILMNAGSALMNGGAPTASSGGTCYLQSDRISGFNKLCEYSCVSGNTVRTISSTQICPLTTTN